MYIKIAPVTPNNYTIEELVSLSLTKDQKIESIQRLSDNKILINITDGGEIQGIIFDINRQDKVQRIKK